MISQSSYLPAINKKFLILLAIHVPALCGVALWFGSGIPLAVVLSLVFMAGPALLYRLNPGAILTSVSLGVSSMCFSALLIHLSGGMIEMHFHIFVMLAFMIAFQSPWPLLASAASIAVHHLCFYLWLPRSVFNYEASFGIVLLHAFFVVLETVPAVWLTYRLSKYLSVQRRLGEELATTSHKVSEAARQVFKVSQTLAGGAATQAESVEKTAASSEHISETIRQTADDARKASILTMEARRAAEAGHRMLKELAESMNSIAISSTQIRTIVKTIDEIAFQTNILAINAAVEAARAGESGLGFSVVAEEVRGLAQRSAESALKTGEIVEDCVVRAREGEQRLRTVEDNFATISGRVGDLARFLESLESSSNQGYAGAAEVATAIAKMDVAARQTAAEANSNAEVGSVLVSEEKRLDSIAASVGQA